VLSDLAQTILDPMTFEYFLAIENTSSGYVAASRIIWLRIGTIELFRHIRHIRLEIVLNYFCHFSPPVIYLI